MNREEWLEKAVEYLQRIFKEKNHPLVPVRVSIGWPSKGGCSKNRVRGEAWAPETAADGKPQIFVSPGEGTSYESLEVLALKLIDVLCPGEKKSSKNYKNVCADLGFTGKGAHIAPGPELKVELEGIRDLLPAYPHAKLVKVSGQGSKKQSTRMRKIYCPRKDFHEGKEYILRGSKSTFEMGIPKCVCGTDFVLEEEEKEKET